MESRMRIFKQAKPADFTFPAQAREYTGSWANTTARRLCQHWQRRSAFKVFMNPNIFGHFGGAGEVKAIELCKKDEYSTDDYVTVIFEGGSDTEGWRTFGPISANDMAFQYVPTNSAVKPIVDRILGTDPI
jgi:hypothetical protein